MLIGKVVKKTGFSKDTIRYYEKLGLISVDCRKENNYKEYSDETVNILLVVKKLKKVGFTLREIKELIDLFEENSYSCQTVMDRATFKIRAIDERIAQLNRFKSLLLYAVKNCEGYSRGELCPTFEGLWGRS